MTRETALYWVMQFGYKEQKVLLLKGDSTTHWEIERTRRRLHYAMLISIKETVAVMHRMLNVNDPMYYIHNKEVRDMVETMLNRHFTN